MVFFQVVGIVVVSVGVVFLGFFSFIVLKDDMRAKKEGRGKRGV